VKLYMFRTVRLSIIRILFTVHSAMVYVIQVCRQISSRTRMELKLVRLVGSITEKVISGVFHSWWKFYYKPSARYLQSSLCA